MALQLLVILIVSIIYTIYITIRFLTQHRKHKTYASTTGTITSIADANKKGKKCVTVSYTIPSGTSYSQTYKLDAVKDLAVGTDTQVYFDPSYPYQSFTGLEESILKRQITLMSAFISVMLIMFAVMISSAMPKDVSNQYATEVTVEVNPFPTDMIEAEKLKNLAPGSLSPIKPKNSEKSYRSLDHSEEDILLADGRTVTVDHYWGEKRVLVVNEGYSSKYFKTTYYFVTSPIENSDLILMATFHQSGATEIADINERIEETLAENSLQEIFETGTIKEKKTVLEVPENLQSVGSETADFQSDKYIFPVSEDNKDAEEIAVVSWEGILADYSFSDIQWDQSSLCCYSSDAQVDFYFESSPAAMGEKYLYGEDEAKVSATSDNALHVEVLNNDAWLWTNTECGTFAIRIRREADLDKVRKIFDSVTFVSEDFDQITAAGPQAKRRISYTKDENTREFYHTAGLDCYWYQDRLSELGIKDDIKIEMSISYSPQIIAKMLYSSGNIANQDLVLDSHTDTMMAADLEITYCTAAAYENYTIADTKRVFLCDAYLPDPQSGLTLVCHIKAEGVFTIPEEELKEILKRCFE